MQVGASMIWQTGFPIAITGADTGAALTRPDRVEGVPFVLPENLWGWYDGRTSVTLPSGRVITPPARSYLKYNPDAFGGRVMTTPSGRIVADQFWYGNAAITYDEIRTDNRFNLDMSIRRLFGLGNGTQLEIGADAMNILNHTQFSGAYTSALGATVTMPNPALGSYRAWAVRRITGPGAWRRSICDRCSFEQRCGSDAARSRGPRSANPRSASPRSGQQSVVTTG
jgi:hypothetical protein